MGAACKTCGGVGHGRIEPGVGWVAGGDPVAPCEVCNAGAEPRPASMFAPKAMKRNTVEVVDGEYRPGMEDEPYTDAAGAGFSPAQIAAQQAADLRAMQAEGMTKRRR